MVDVQNTGKVAGEEVVQLYIKRPGPGTLQPMEELKGFRRVAFKPGERKTVEMSLPAKSLMQWNPSRHSFFLESGKIELLAGASSADIRLRKTIAVAN
jgi:beta-glucosidase